MSQDFPARIQISYKELTAAKQFLDNQPKFRNAPHNGLKHVSNERTKIISEDTKRLFNRDLTPPKKLQTKHSKDTASYPSNHGMLRIPKEMDSILRCEKSKQTNKDSENTNTVDFWERFNRCSSQLVEMNSHKEMANTSAKYIYRAKMICDEMCHITAKIINSDIEFCISHPIENELWYKGVYLVIECLRERSRHNHESSTEFLSFLTSAMEYYTALISSIQSNYNFSLSVVDNISSILSEFEQKKILRAVQCCHFLYLALGDISRYQVVLREMIRDIGVSVEYDWSTIIVYYQKAMQLAPNSGRAYNQLAIVSANQFKYLDTVYHYVRCLSAQNAFTTVREALLHTFHNIEKQNLEPVVKNTKEKTHPNKHKLKCENEIWIIPENSKKQTKNFSEAKQTEEIPIQFSRKISPASFQKLCKDAYLSFLTIQAKFFTNIGIDKVSDWLTTFENSLTSILKNKFNQSLSEVLLKMQLIVLFSLTNQNTESKSSQMYKLDFLFLFHFLLIQSMQRNLQSDGTVQTNALYLLPIIRIFIQWLRHNSEMWSEDIIRFGQHRIWNVVNLLVNNLQSLQFKTEEVLTNNNQSFLWEDQLLSGCVVTNKFILTRMSWEQQQLNIQDQQSISYRIDLIISDLRILSKLPNFPIRFDEKDVSFKLTNIPKIESENRKSRTPSVPSDFVESYENTFDDHELLSDEDEFLFGDSDDNQDEFHLLKTEKNRLEAEVNKQTLQINKHKQQQTILRHEITPKYIVPDTNCYLSHFSLIQQLYFNSYLQLIVPLIVLQELQHLRKPISKSQKHLSSCSRAKDAYGWIMDKFSSSEKKLFGLTNQGNLVENLYKQDFSTVRNQRNDDLILQSCVKLNESWYRAADTDCMNSCVVLLTSDRNLRLKAVAQNLPAKSLKKFLNLMNMSL